MNLLRGDDQLVAHRVLHAQIDRELDRLLQPVGGEPRHVQRGKPAAVEPFLDAGDALVVDVDVADQVRDLGAVRIDALVLGEEADARQAEPVDFLLLLGVISRLSQTKPRARAEPVAHFGGVEIGQHGGQQLDRLVDVDDPARLGEQRRRAHVGREDLAVAIEDVGTRGRDRVPAPRRAARYGFPAPPRTSPAARR